MITFIRKHWKKMFFALATLFWAGCSDDSSSSANVLYGCPDDVCGDPTPSSSNPNDTLNSFYTSSSYMDPSSSNYDPDELIPPMSSTAYGIQPLSSSSSSYMDSSSSNYDPDDLIPPMSSTAYGIQPLSNSSSSSSNP